MLERLRHIAWVRSAISSTKTFQQFIYDIPRSLFLQKVTAIESLSVTWVIRLPRSGVRRSPLVQPFRTIVLIGLCFGLRISEIMGLRWTDFDFKRSVVLIQRSAVGKRLNKLKTEYSRGPDRTGLYSRTEQMASALCRDRGAMAVPESGDWSALSCRFDSCRLPGSNRSPVGTWEDRVPHVPPHLPSLAGLNRSTRGRAAETHATRARLHHNGSVWK